LRFTGSLLGGFALLAALREKPTLVTESKIYQKAFHAKPPRSTDAKLAAFATT
jgi:hypothetical protein